MGKKDKVQWRFAFNSKNDYKKVFHLMDSFRNSVIVVDEADALFSVREFAEPLSNVFLGSRNNGLSMIFVAKRPFLLPILIRSQADEYIIFGTQEKRDIDYLGNRLRNKWPKEPHLLQRGEAIIYREGEPMEIKKFSKFNHGEKVNEQG